MRLSMKNNTVIEFESGRYWIEDDLIHMMFIDKEKEAFTIDDADMHLDAYDKLTNIVGIVPILIDLRNVHSIIPLPVLRYISNKAATLNKNDNAKAYLINSLGVRLLVNFYVRVIMDETESKVFEDEKEALYWLAQYKKSNNKTKTQ